ncbi:50S ribosomal protein L17 [bacterium]|nr:50S ribosomal protein L17 [bacterium]
MRHLNKGRQLSRSSSHKKALMINLAQDLIEHKRIKTTLGKAKELRPFVEPLITKAKTDTLASRRDVARFFSKPAVMQTLFSEVGPKNVDRPGGYTRVIKLGVRVGDAAPMAIIELVGYEGVQAAPAPAADDKKAAAKSTPKKAAKKAKKAAA